MKFNLFLRALYESGFSRVVGYNLLLLSFTFCAICSVTRLQHTTPY